MNHCAKSSSAMEPKLKSAYAWGGVLVVAWVFCGWYWVRESLPSLCSLGDTPIYVEQILRTVRKCLANPLTFDFATRVPPALFFPTLLWSLMGVSAPEVCFWVQTTIVLGIALAVERIATHLYERWTGFISVFVYLTALIIDSEVRNFDCDAIMGLGICWAYYASLKMREREKELGPCIAFACWWCLAALSKWAAIPLWLGFFTVYMLWRLLVRRRETSEDKYCRWLYGWKRWSLLVIAIVLAIVLAVFSGWRMVVILQLLAAIGALMVPRARRWAQLERWVFYMSLACTMVGVVYCHNAEEGYFLSIMSNNTNALGAAEATYGVETLDISIWQRVGIGLFSFIDFLCKSAFLPCLAKLCLFSVAVSCFCRRFRPNREMLWLIIIPGMVLSLSCFITFVLRYLMAIFGFLCIVIGSMLRRTHVALTVPILLWLLVIKVVFVAGWIVMPYYVVPSNNMYLHSDSFHTDCSAKYSRVLPEQLKWGWFSIFLEHRHDWSAVYLCTGYPYRQPSLDRVQQLWDELALAQHRTPVLVSGEKSQPYMQGPVINSYEEFHRTERIYGETVFLDFTGHNRRRLNAADAPRLRYMIMVSAGKGTVEQRRRVMVERAHKDIHNWRLVQFYPRLTGPCGYYDRNDVALFYCNPLLEKRQNEI